MLRKRFVLFMFVMLAGATARANTINIISQSYRIEGYGAGYGNFGPQETVLYDETSDAPLTRYDTGSGTCSFGGVTGGCGLFILYNLASGGVNSTGAFVQAVSHTDDASFAIAVYARATASITFMALEPELFLKTETYGRASTRIYDETAGSLIFFENKQTNAIVGGELTPPFFTYVLPFDLGHIYTMTASADVCCLARGDTKLTITSVAESQDSWGFLIIGLSGLLLVSVLFNPANLRKPS